MITADTSILMFFSLAAACIACAIRPAMSPEIRAMLTDGEQVRATLSVQERRSLSSGEVYYKAVYTYEVYACSYRYSMRYSGEPPREITLYYELHHPEKASTCGRLANEW